MKRVIALIIFIATFIATMVLLCKSPYANGWDGYYYIVQVKSWFTEGAMHSEDHSLVYVLLVAIQYIIKDYILSYKIASAIIRAFFVTAVYLLSFKIIKETKTEKSEKSDFSVCINALIISVISAVSVSSIYFITQFPKNMLGFAFLLTMLCFFPDVYKSAREKQFKKTDVYNAVFCSLLFLCTFVTHRYSGGIAAITLFVLGFTLLLKRVQHIPYLFISSAFFIIVLIAVSLAFPGTLHFYDLERFSGAFNSRFVFTVFEFLNIISYKRAGVLWSVELWVYYLCSVLFIISYMRSLIKREKHKVLYFAGIFVIIGLGVFPFYNFDPSGIGYRFYLGAQLFLPLACLIFFVDMHFDSQLFLPVLFIVMMTLSIFLVVNYDYKKYDPPYEKYHGMSLKLIKRLGVTKNDYHLFIMHKALAEIFTYETGLDALPWAPGLKYEGARVLRLVYGVEPELYKKYLVDEELAKVFLLQGSYTCIEEDVFKIFCDRLKQDDPAAFEKINNWRNPLKVRPDYLMRGKKR
ncbi:MAG: hypothetical protein JXK07_03975 [Spirochaetes bacterium]|nr:hypothetical protein [Spirochaetota bacterium]MBN2770353.1 hypothetical protein [Spirochaetota bacterium]